MDSAEDLQDALNNYELAKEAFMDATSDEDVKEAHENGAYKVTSF